MHPVIYDVAVSIDGYIAGPQGDISKFPHQGEVVDDYFERLKTYSVAIMGKHTYEFAYRFGMKPGDNPYAHAKTYIVSNSILLPEKRQVEVLSHIDGKQISALKNIADGPIYLCGGGAFAGSMLAMGLIDLVRLKRVPIILGGGTPLFGNAAPFPDMAFVHEKSYGDGCVFQEYAVSV